MIRLQQPANRLTLLLGNLPGTPVTTGNLPVTPVTTGNLPGPVTTGNLPGPVTTGNLPGATVTTGNLPGIFLGILVVGLVSRWSWRWGNGMWEV